MRSLATQSRVGDGEVQPADEPPVELLPDWMDESYRTIASQRLVKLGDQEE